MKKFSPSLLTLALSSVLLTSTFAYSQINADDKDTLGVKEQKESLLFHQSLTKEGSDNVPIWRIPSLLRTKDGVLIAAADKRWQHRGDWGDIDTAIRISHDDGKTWGNISTILDLVSQNEGNSPVMNSNTNPWGDKNDVVNKRKHHPDYSSQYMNSAFLIDAQMVQDKRNGRIFLSVDMFPESAGFFHLNGAFNNPSKDGSGRVNIGGKQYLKLMNKGKQWTLREDGSVFDESDKKTGYRVVIEGTPSKNFKDLGDIYNEKNENVGNIYLTNRSGSKNQNAPFHIPTTSYLWMTYSDDNGKTWSNPIDISAQVKKDWMRFLGTGPGVGIQTKNGNLIFPVYYTNQNNVQSSALIISKDGGKTWDLGQSPNDSRSDLWGQNSRNLKTNSMGHELTESQLVELENGDLKLFMRNTSGKVMMSTSKDGGYTWVDTKQVEKLDHGYSQLSVIKYSKKINGREYIIFSGQSEKGASGDQLRRNGKLYLGEVQANGDINWDTSKLVRNIKSIGKANGTLDNGYVYSSMAELGDGSIGLAYENSTDYRTIMYLPIAMQEFFWKADKLFSDIRQKDPLVFTYSGEKNLEKIGDGIAIKRGEGESQGGITVSEGLLVLDQQTKDDKNKAFTKLILNNSGVVQVNSQQNLDELVLNKNASGYLQFTVTDTNTPQLKINNDVNANGQVITVKVNLQKKLQPNTKGYYHAQGEELISYKDNGTTQFQLVNGEISDGMYVYTVATVPKPSVFRSTTTPHSLYITNKLVTADGKAVSTVAPLSTPKVINARPLVNPILASYLSSSLAISQVSNQVQHSFMQQLGMLQHNDRSLFVKYFDGQQKYVNNLGFIDYGYHFDTHYKGVMLGGKLWQSAQNGHALYMAMNKMQYKVKPMAIDGDTQGKYQSWGINTNWHSTLLDHIQFDVSAGYQTHKGDIVGVNGALKGRSVNAGADIGYRFAVNESLSLIPYTGLHYLQTTLSNLSDTAHNVEIRFNSLKATKTNVGLDVAYKLPKFELQGHISYDFYRQNKAGIWVDNVAYKQGKLANTLNLSAQLSANITPHLSLSTDVGMQQADKKAQYLLGVSAAYHF
ncbi:exo-alpha-sialidase [Bisgaard Taxon 45]|uniref:exo-alpha-sialidase n=1 Tax=Bisgaard Taxon 45 TaxID=304289 RepID=A0ABT9KC11_9PAST|nr:exo-alpha-sialidase [Bisgaard Taxon 45]